jgi:hypothetical protein
LIAQELERVVDSFEESGVVDLKLGNTPQGGAVVTENSL